MFGLGTMELVLIFIIVLVLFGAKRLPEIGKGLGQAIRNFKKGYQEVEEELDLREDIKRDNLKKETNKDKDAKTN